jgi:hypothetical protein
MYFSSVSVIWLLVDGKNPAGVPGGGYVREAMQSVCVMAQWLGCIQPQSWYSNINDVILVKQSWNILIIAM